MHTVILKLIKQEYTCYSNIYKNGTKKDMRNNQRYHSIISGTGNNESPGYMSKNVYA